MLSQVAWSHHFLWLHNIPLCVWGGHACTCVCIHLLFVICSFMIIELIFDIQFNFLKIITINFLCVSSENSEGILSKERKNSIDITDTEVVLCGLWHTHECNTETAWNMSLLLWGVGGVQVGKGRWCWLQGYIINWRSAFTVLY